MTDDKKQAADMPKVDEKPTEAPAADAPAPAADAGRAGGTDQHGRQLFDVTCSSCGNAAQVPFKPSGDRPVYCRDCYMKQRGGGQR